MLSLIHIYLDGFPPAGDAEGGGVVVVHPFLGLDGELELQRFRPFLFYLPQDMACPRILAGLQSIPQPPEDGTG